MRMMDVDEWASAHHGLITRTRLKIRSDAWRRMLAAGRIEELLPGVARLPGTPRTPHQRIAAALLAAGTGALASHRSAAFLWDLVPPRRVVDVLVPDRRRHATLEGVRLHRPTDVLQLSPRRRSGIPCTDVLRTLCDLGAVDPSAVTDAVGAALSRRLAGLDALERTVQAHTRRGRPGVTALRRAIDEWSIDAKPADSVLEQAMVALVERHSLPPVEFHQRIGRWEVDFRFRSPAVLVERDGWTSHGLDRAQFERDRRKDDDLHAAGWIVVRLTYRSIVRKPAETARRLQRVVDRWAHIRPPDTH
jgi:very-short-patch-repair endonuclease